MTDQEKIEYYAHIKALETAFRMVDVGLCLEDVIRISKMINLYLEKGLELDLKDAISIKSKSKQEVEEFIELEEKIKEFVKSM